jgi:hypothetical protein
VGRDDEHGPLGCNGALHPRGRRRSFSAAATQLGIGQPAVSKTVAPLEERLGVQLIVCTTRNLSLTDAGRRFYDNAKQAIDGVNLAERVRAETEGLTGTLRVSASVCFSRVHVMPRLPEFFAVSGGGRRGRGERPVREPRRGTHRPRPANGTSCRLLADGAKDRPGASTVMASASYWKAHGRRGRRMTSSLTSASSSSARTE